ncbi:MAG: hypothetical protein Q8P10_01265 [bacterium]|nr:hypothetical protein [bacterium]
MKGKNIAIVIPTIRNLDFLEFWGDEFEECIGIILEDRPDKTIETPSKFFKQIFHFSWKEIDKELGKNSWIIQRKNAGIRNFGFLKAWQFKSDITVTLDDDCYPIKEQKFLKSHFENLSSYSPSDWFPTYPHRKYFCTRGFPYSVRGKFEVVISHGLWKNILDLDAKTHLKNDTLKIPYSFDFMEFIPKNYFFPMSSMNLAFKTRITPIMYFPLMGTDSKGKKWGYDRFDDIWCGIFAKKILDHLGLSVINGSPFIEHKKASDNLKNVKKEENGIKTNENLFKIVQNTKLSSKNLKSSYLELFEKANFPKNKYFDNLKKATKIWLSFFE